MIVCHCAAVSDREIRAHAERGVRTTNELSEHCDAGQMCGGCRPLVEQILALHTARDAALAS